MYVYFGTEWYYSLQHTPPCHYPVETPTAPSVPLSCHIYTVKHHHRNWRHHRRILMLCAPPTPRLNRSELPVPHGDNPEAHHHECTFGFPLFKICASVKFSNSFSKTYARNGQKRRVGVGERACYYHGGP